MDRSAPRRRLRLAAGPASPSLVVLRRWRAPKTARSDGAAGFARQARFARFPSSRAGARRDSGTAGPAPLRPRPAGMLMPAIRMSWGRLGTGFAGHGRPSSNPARRPCPAGAVADERRGGGDRGAGGRRGDGRGVGDGADVAGCARLRADPTHPGAVRHPSPEGIQGRLIGVPSMKRGARQGGVCRQWPGV